MFRGTQRVWGWAAAAVVALPSLLSSAQAQERRVPIWQAQTDGSYSAEETPASNVPTAPVANDRLATKLRASNYQNTAPVKQASRQEPLPMAPGSDLGSSQAAEPVAPPAESGWETNGGTSTGGCASGSCSTGGCSSGCCASCGNSCDGDCCDSCTPFWAHRCSAYGEYLYLHPTGAAMAYGAQAVTDGSGIATPGAPTLGNVPYGRVGVLDPVAQGGFRAGGSIACDLCSSVNFAYTQFQSHEEDSLVNPPNNLLGSTTSSFVLHPGTANYTTPTAQQLFNGYDIDFRTVDLEYSRLLSGGCNHYLNYIVGVRWGQLEQQFFQVGDFAQPVGTIATFTSTDFEGVGLRTGLDGRRKLCGGFSVYGKGFVNVLDGHVRSRYYQYNATADFVEATVNWKDSRIMTILETELGVSWTNCSQNLRLSTGYYTAFWFNAVTTGDFIRAVQNSNYNNVSDTIAFNGLMARAEVLW